MRERAEDVVSIATTVRVALEKDGTCLGYQEDQVRTPRGCSCYGQICQVD